MSKSHKNQVFKRIIDLGKVTQAEVDDLVRIWRVGTGDEKAMRLADFIGTLSSAVIHNSTLEKQGGTTGEYYHLTEEELLKLQNLVENVSANRRTVRGTVTYLDPVTARVELYSWVIDGTEWSVTLEDLTTEGVPVDFPREDYFIGLDDGTVEYRPAVVDFFGNSTPPTVADNEVVLEIVQRNIDGSEDVVEPPASDFSNFLFETAPEENTVGKYSKIFEGTITPNANYQLHIQYAAPSADPDWVSSASGKSGLLVVNVFAHEGVAITGLQFYTVDPASQVGDWVIQRFGDTFSIYHYSTQYWMHAYFRVTFTNYPALIDSLLSGQSYTTLPSSPDQQLSSTPFASGIANEIAYFTSERVVGSLPVATYPSLAELAYVKGVTSGIQTQLTDRYTKAESDPLASTGSVIEFDRPRTYDDPSSPNTNTTLTEDNTPFRPVTQVIFHQAASFNPPATWEKSTGSDDYDPAKINVIYVEAFSATYKRYIIDHDE